MSRDATAGYESGELCESGDEGAGEGQAVLDVDDQPRTVPPHEGERLRVHAHATAAADHPDAVQDLVKPKQGKPADPSQSVLASLAGLDKGALHAAQLAIFTPAVQDTIVLNQIK